MKVKRNEWALYRLLAIALLSVAGTSALAQVGGSISGRIEDSSGAAIPQAALTITNLETGATRSVVTDEAGNYRVLSLAVGQYQIKAGKTGFREQIQTGFHLVVGQEAIVNLRLEVGEVQQQVTVVGEAPVVNTSTASVSGLVGERQVKDLPLNGRSFDNLITLNASAVNYTARTGMAQTGAGEGASFTVVGRRADENLFLVNGIEYMGGGITATLPGGVSGQLLGVDAVREFNVLSSVYSVEYGKRAGAQVTIVTQSGTNQLHGSVFEFLRNSKVDARNFFDHGPVPPFKRNQFGGSVGAPIRKDKTFIFGSYEGFRQRLGISAVTFVPDLNARQGLLPNAQGLPTPVPGLNPAMLPYTAFWPLPNGPNLGGGVAETFSNPAQAIREDFGTVRFDQNFSDRDLLSVTHTVDDGFSVNPTQNPIFGLVVNLRNQVFSLQETHIFSPQVVNTFTAGFSRSGFALDTPPLLPVPSNLTLVVGRTPGGVVIGGNSTTGGGVSALTPAGGAAGGTAQAHDLRNLFTYQDTVQMIKGKHQITTGVWFQRLRFNEANFWSYYGTINFANLQSFLQGTASQAVFNLIGTPLSWRSLQGAWFIQDALQVRPNLTVRLGLRHEFTNGWKEAAGRVSNYGFDPSGVLLTTPTISDSQTTENNGKWLFGPRIGLAWDPFGKGKTSVRAGFGTSYTFPLNSFYLDGNPPFNGGVTFLNAQFPSLVPINPSTAVPPPCGPGVPAPCTLYRPGSVENSLKVPTVNSWNFSVEQQITPNMALRVGYLGSRGVHDIVNADSNTVHPLICSSPAGCTSGGVGAARGTVPQGAEYLPVGTRPNPYLPPALNAWFSEGSNSYNALQVEVTRRWGHGLQFRSNYTWSKNLDIGSLNIGGQSSNSANKISVRWDPSRDWGRSNLDIRHQASSSFSYELPIGYGKAWLSGVSSATAKLISGWQVNGIVTLLSGPPVSPLVGSNQSGDGNTSALDRPSVNPAFTGPLILGKPSRWFDPNAFMLQTPGTYGNAGRGIITAPGLAEVNFSLFKTTRISERVGLQFRAETFNIFNRTNFSFPTATVFLGGGISPTAGRISSTSTTSRQIQFSLKLSF